jgi:hypothetical protein
MLTLALFLAASQAEPPVPQPAVPQPAAPCAESGGLLPGSGLCRADALTRLPRGPWTPSQGCDVTAQEAQLTGGRWLLYAALRCGEKTARLAVTPQQGGALVLRYAETARNPELIGRKALTIVESNPEHLAVYTLAAAGLPQPQAHRCALRTPPAQGYPYDAFVYDLSAAETRQTAALDLPCGPYGRSAWPDTYWRLFSGIGAYYQSSGERPEFDPASLTVFKP